MPVRDCTPSELAVRADLALYAAKHHGRDQVWSPAAVMQTIESSPRHGLVRTPSGVDELLLKAS